MNLESQLLGPGGGRSSTHLPHSLQGKNPANEGRGCSSSGTGAVLIGLKLGVAWGEKTVYKL